MADEFIKVKDGVKAPKGFHYMPNGKLMSDADHVAQYGYIEKTISNFNFDSKDISYLGETRTFSVHGDKGAVFSLEIHDDNTTPNYYNFNTNTWSSTKSGLYNVELDGMYSFSINFDVLGFTDATCDYNNDPTITHDDDDGAIEAGMTVVGTGIPLGATVSSVTSDTAFELTTSTTGGAFTNSLLRFSKLKTYTINLRAVTIDNIKTIYAPLKEFRNADNSINTNKSSGSDSDLLKKLLYQDVQKNIHLSCTFPSNEQTGAGTVDGATSSSNRIVLDQDATDLSVVQIGDQITTTGVADSVFMTVTKINPDNDNVKEIEVSVADSCTNDAAITFTPAFYGTTPGYGGPGPVFTQTTGRHSIAASSGSNVKTNFSITCTAPSGRTLTAFRTPTTDDLCAVKFGVTIGSAALAISGEDTSSASVFYRWPVDNIAGFSEGMVLDPSRTDTGENTTTPANISRYSTTISSTELDERKYYTDILATTLEDVTVPGVDNYGNDVTAVDRNGRITAQAGNLTFNVQQADALKGDAVKIYAYGARQIEQLTGMEVEVSDIVVTPTQVSTTTTGTVSNSTTIPVTLVTNISTNSTIRGVNIDSSAVNPTVTLKSVKTGAGNLTASAAQTLESGQTLYFDNASNIITITGTISISNIPLSDTTLYFDLERFLTAS